MTQYPISQIAEIVGARMTGKGTDTISTPLIDSRGLAEPQGVLFFALTTDKDDGHRYIDDLYEQGVRNFVVSREDLSPGDYPEATFLTVPDTLAALQSLATYHRSTLKYPVVGITGSNGKTTFKELLFQLLRPHRTVGRSPRSYNSSIGVPLSIWGLTPELDLALIEAGISAPGGMDLLEPIIKPNIGVLTHIGEAHQEHFESLEQKLDEKLKLFRGSDLLIIDKDNELIRSGIKRAGLRCKVLGWSKEDPTAELFVERLTHEPSHTTIACTLRGQQRSYRVPLLDEGSLQDLFLALVLLSEVAPEVAEDQGVFEKLYPIDMRLEVLEGVEDMLLINDTYNADYDSLRIALSYMERRNIDHRPKSVILSEFRESSNDPAGLYRRIGDLLGAHDLQNIIAIGEGLLPYLSVLGQGVPYFASVEEFLAWKPAEQLGGHIVLLKGARMAHFERITNALIRRVHQTILDVNLSRLASNLNLYRAHIPKGRKVTCMIKAFGYGVGSYEIAKVLEAQKVDYLAVAVSDEGKELREHGIKVPIMIMNPEPSAYRQMIRYHLEPNLYSLSILKDFIRTAELLGEHDYPVHLKWDTGMHRLGFELREVKQVLEVLRGTSAVHVASIFTHLSVADDPTEDEYTRAQLDLMDKISEEMHAGLTYPFLKHALNTAGATRFADYESDMIRLGAGLYGLSPLESHPMGVEPVASLRTLLLQTRELPAGATVGYGRKGVLTRPSRVGVIPIGYADGLPRALGNGAVRFRTEDGTLVPTLGNICMDTTILDLTDAPLATEGSTITIFDDTLPIARIADASGTIDYEVLARLSMRISRHYFSE